MIKPTIFIGLGTTGTDILKTLRQLMSEEYENAGLPVFRYIAIDTREDETGDNLRNFKDYERVEVVNATIENLALIQNRLDPDQPYYNLQLAEWLNSALLNEFESSKDGARNIRMAGRLCLWENWEQIRHTLSRACSSIIAVQNGQETFRILTQHYEARNLDVPPQLVDYSGINVYVVGTLCGGTCSGMLIDIAYLIRNILGDGMANKITGIFTMHDQFLAESNELESVVRSANCYASLSELNYYNHPNTTYDVTFPNGLRVNTTRKPFDYELVVSPSGKIPHIRHVSPNGSVDEYSLNLMVALNLFAETAADTGGNKAMMRTDGVGSEGYGELKPVPSGEIPTMTRCLASFGLTAVWYPKYRIAKAAACFVSRELCNNLKGTQTTSAEIKADVSNEWHRILGNVDILTSPQLEGQPSLTDEIGSFLDSANETFKGVSSMQLMEKMNAFPGGQRETFSSMFDVDGKYFDWMKSKLDECKRVFFFSIDQLLDNQLARVDFDDTYGLGDVRVFFEELNLIIEQVIQQYSSEIPQLELSELDFEPMRRAENNIWTKIAGFQKDAIRSHQENLVEEFRQLIDGNEGIYQKVCNYFLRQVLLDVETKLGFTMPSDGPTIKQQLEQIQSNLNDCIVTLNEEYNENIQPPGYECVKIVANNPQNSIQIDAESLSDQISNDITSAGLLVENGNPITMATFLKKGHEDLMRQMTETLQRVALDKINDEIANGTAVTKVQEILNAGGDDIRILVERSNPYIEFSPMYEPLALDCGTKIVIGCDLIEQSLDNLKDAVYFDRTGDSSVDHFLFFYQEEAGFALDDLATYEPFKNHFEGSPSPYGHSTHQDPDFYNLTFQQKKQKLQQWCNVLAPLVPLIWERVTADAFGNVFRRENDKCIFEYDDIDGVMTTLELLDDLNGIEKLSREENSAAYNHFFQSVRDGFAQIDRGKINHLINEMLNLVEDLNERQDLDAMYIDFLEEVYRTDDN